MLTVLSLRCLRRLVLRLLWETIILLLGSADVNCIEILLGDIILLCMVGAVLLRLFGVLSRILRTWLNLVYTLLAMPGRRLSVRTFRWKWSLRLGCRTVRCRCLVLLRPGAMS